MSVTPNILIIGAGASGMTAAYTAAKNGAKVTVIDHNSEAGKKILITGNGKCNYTNTDISPSHYHSREEIDGFFSDKYARIPEKENFVSAILSEFDFKACIDFFKNIGIEPHIKHFRFDESGYVYPYEGGAAALRDALYKACMDCGVIFKFCTSAADINLDIKNCIKAAGNIHSCNTKIPANIGIYDALIIATGSNAYPATGSDSSVYPLLKELGLKFNTFSPALCALYSKDDKLKELKGKRTRANAELLIDFKPLLNAYGEIQFNEHSISGIPVMQLSGFAAGALAAKKNCELRICGHTFKIHRTAGFDGAQCCSGGVSLSEIYSDTLMLKKFKNIYVCGELLDIYGDCGGYNLHFAWASGYIAGKNAAKQIKV